MDKLTKELNRATEYIRAMKRTGCNEEDCDNVLLHLGNIENLVRGVLLSNISSGDKHLESINDIMWNSCMVKDRDFGRKEGFKIMEVLEDWSTLKNL